MLAASAASSRATQVYNFAVLAGSSIQFNGSAYSFQFNNPPIDPQWAISESGGSGAQGLQGYFSGGPWTYGAITTVGSLQYATVNPGMAMLTINDGAGHLATANVVWGLLDTVGTSGAFNENLAVNLSDLSYSGANADLSSFFSASSGQLDLSFQTSTMDLAQLSSGSGPYTTSFSGSINVVPEPAPVLIFGLGFLLLGWRMLKKKSAADVR